MGGEPLHVLPLIHVATNITYNLAHSCIHLHYM